MSNLNNKISIITGKKTRFNKYSSLNLEYFLNSGASSGIGRATAILFSNLGSKLVLVGRDENELDQTIQSCNPESKSSVFV
jgi:NADP-dependent 3-hydroxy acid dehydrogenase YdfG